MTPAAGVKKAQELLNLAMGTQNYNEARAALKACQALLRQIGEAMAVAAAEEVSRQVEDGETRARTISGRTEIGQKQKLPRAKKVSQPKPVSEIMTDAAVRGGAQFARDVTREVLSSGISSFFGGRRS